MCILELRSQYSCISNCIDMLNTWLYYWIDNGDKKGMQEGGLRPWDEGTLQL